MTGVLIIGGGASGVLAAAHLLRHCPAASITLIERRGRLGAGTAFGTDNPFYLLNARAGDMSAYDDAPKHFARWLASGWVGAGGARDCSQSFAPRILYQHYLRHVLEDARRSAPSGALTVMTADIVDLVETATSVQARTAAGQVLTGDIAILATGKEAAEVQRSGKILDGWSRLPLLARDASVVMVGTGLTMADHVAALMDANHQAPIVAISPDGRLPQLHRRVAVQAITESELPETARLLPLFRWLRERIRRSAAEGRDWRATVDGLRPHAQALWARLDAAEQRRFLRHCASLWNAHRYRMPKATAERIRRACASGRLTIVKGRVVAVDVSGKGVQTTVAQTGASGASRILAHDVVIDCRDVRADIGRTGNLLLRNLLASRRARSDRLGLGLDVTSDMELISPAGCASDRVYALGPLTTGAFWESSAIPGIRVQARRLARRIAGR